MFSFESCHIRQIWVWRMLILFKTLKQKELNTSCIMSRSEEERSRGREAVQRFRKKQRAEVEELEEIRKQTRCFMAENTRLEADNRGLKESIGFMNTLLAAHSQQEPGFDQHFSCSWRNSATSSSTYAPWGASSSNPPQWGASSVALSSSTSSWSVSRSTSISSFPSCSPNYSGSFQAGHANHGYRS